MFFFLNLNFISRKIKINRRKQTNNKGSKAVFPCTLCKRKFFVERRLEGHLRQHEGKKPAVCNICGKEFSKWGGLDAHILNAHSNIGKPFICEEPECGRTYTMKQSLVSHVRKVHLKIVDKSATSVYICESCGKSFASSGTLKVSLKIKIELRHKLSIKFVFFFFVETFIYSYRTYAIPLSVMSTKICYET